MTNGNEQKITAQKGIRINDEDRLALASLLVKFGYTVRIGKELRQGERANTIYVAYSEQGGDRG